MLGSEYFEQQTLTFKSNNQINIYCPHFRKPNRKFISSILLLGFQGLSDISKETYMY